jgi:hypothetical protein
MFPHYFQTIHRQKGLHHLPKGFRMWYNTNAEEVLLYACETSQADCHRGGL